MVYPEFLTSYRKRCDHFLKIQYSLRAACACQSYIHSAYNFSFDVREVLYIFKNPVYFHIYVSTGLSIVENKAGWIDRELEGDRDVVHIDILSRVSSHTCICNGHYSVWSGSTIEPEEGFHNHPCCQFRKDVIIMILCSYSESLKVNTFQNQVTSREHRKCRQYKC